MRRTCEHGLPHPLVGDLPVSLAALGKRRVVDETLHVVILLKVCLTALQLFVREVRRDVGHLDVGRVRVQVLGVNL